MAEFGIAGKTLALVQGDITQVEADALGNAANSDLVGGSGVNGAILRAGGKSLHDDLARVRAETGGCETGSAVATIAGDLPADWVLHCVGPIYETGRQGESELLSSCYRSALRLAQEKGAKTVALPSISTGIYGYPMEAAAKVALQTVSEALRSERCTIERVTFVLFGQAAFDTHLETARRLLA